jgi:hypothetical protein
MLSSMASKGSFQTIMWKRSNPRTHKAQCCFVKSEGLLVSTQKEREGVLAFWGTVLFASCEREITKFSPPLSSSGTFSGVVVRV